jgi:hypothetical protein
MSKGKHKRKRERARAKKEETAKEALLMENEKIADNKQEPTKKAGREASANQQPSRWERFKQWAKKDKTFTDWCIAAFTFVLAGAAIYQFIIMGSQLDTMRKDERPWIEITFNTGAFQANAPVSGVMHVVNNGKTPARAIRADIVVERVKNGEEPRLDYPTPHTRFTTGLLFPKTPADSPYFRLRTSSNGTSVEEDPLTESEFDDLQHSRIFFVVYATVSYADFFGTKHWTRMCAFSALSNVVGTATAQKCTDSGDVDTN